jgi:hypothetical protein
MVIYIVKQVKTNDPLIIYRYIMKHITLNIPIKHEIANIHRDILQFFIESGVRVN